MNLLSQTTLQSKHNTQMICFNQVQVKSLDGSHTRLNHLIKAAIAKYFIFALL